MQTLHTFRPLCLWALVILLMSACSPRQPSQAFQVGELLAEVTFDSPLDWEAYKDGSIGVEGFIDGGLYHLQAGSEGFVWALNSTVHTDVILEVETEQLSSFANNAYGLMCRADPDAQSDGYYFFISGDGYYSIRRGVAREINDLIPFTYSDAIHTGQRLNRIRVVCIGDYLALFINNIFVAETRDDRYQSGVAGVTAAAPEGGDVNVTFDNLRIFSGQLTGD